VKELRAIGRGELLGAYLGHSRICLVGDRIVGACLVVDREGVPPDGGPWIIEVFRDPYCSVRGIGSALLIDALAAARSAGSAGISLAVSHTNENARRLYATLGFADCGQSWTLAIPSP
jgi:ribosomal protein S18 acetylase RimI-like enzyme